MAVLPKLITFRRPYRRSVLDPLKLSPAVANDLPFWSGQLTISHRHGFVSLFYFSTTLHSTPLHSAPPKPQLLFPPKVSFPPPPFADASKARLRFGAGTCNRNGPGRLALERDNWPNSAQSGIINPIFNTRVQVHDLRHKACDCDRQMLRTRRSQRPARGASDPVHTTVRVGRAIKQILDHCPTHPRGGTAGPIWRRITRTRALLPVEMCENGQMSSPQG
ncbi:unnamed protein product [Protopolystoma xenopodis]|uniref:Uncharacterized protein n=1 Tax=Protopolystoma xenopodis TaxID=117903 RepID=A0A3S5CHB6_9PLAT|nr:unnamed protein product [Protopolystoma xenopodis]